MLLPRCVHYIPLPGMQLDVGTINQEVWGPLQSPVSFNQVLLKSSIVPGNMDEINKSFENFLTEVPEKPTVDPKLIEHKLEMSDESPKDQFLLLGSISNYHKYGYPSLKEEGGIIHVENITYVQHVFYDDKFSKTGLDGERIRTYIPPSPRNRIMYFMDTGKEGELFQLVKHILKGDQANETHGHKIKMEPPPVPRKKRKHSSCLFSVSQCSLYSSWGRY